MKKTLSSKTQVQLFFGVTVSFVLIVFIVTSSFVIYNVNSCECYIGNYDEYICYDGEVYYRICDENKDMFSEEFLDNYLEYNIATPDDFDRWVTVRGLNTSILFLTEKVSVVYNNSDYDKVVFLSLAQFPETRKDYAIPDK